MAKLNRERAVRERRERKQARKDARKLAAESAPQLPAEDPQVAVEPEDAPPR